MPFRRLGEFRFHDGLGVDSMSLSAHKIGAQGVGALVVADGLD